jgi:hypothetical protein
LQALPQDMSRPRRATWRRWPYALIISVCALVAYNPRLDGDLDLRHEGERLAAVDAQRAGALAFRDVYVPHGWGEDVFAPMLACRLFGDSVASLRALGSNAYVARGVLPALGAAALLVAVAAMVRRPFFVILAGVLLLLIWCEPTDRHLLGFLSLAAVAAGASGARPKWLIVGGALATAAALYSLDVGCYALGAELSWAVLDPMAMQATWKERGVAMRGRVGRLVGGAAVTALPFVAWCVWHGVLDDFLHNAYIQVFMRREIFPPKPYPNPFASSSALELARTVSLFYAPPLLSSCILALTWVFRARLPARSRSLLILAAVPPLFFWMSVSGRADIWHVAYATPAFLPTVVAFASLFRPETRDPPIASRGAGPSLRKVRTAILVLLGLCVAGLVLAGHGGTAGRRMFGEPPFYPAIYRSTGQKLVPCTLGRCGDIRIEPTQLEFTARAVQAIRRLSTPDDTILDLSDNPLLYFLAERRGATRFYLRVCWGPSQLLQGEAMREILANPRPPACVVRRAHPGPEDRIDRWVNARYVIDEEIGELQFWRPR